MERGGGSGERSRIVAKSRSSSGCLSLKGESNGVSRTVSSTGTRRSFKSKSEKKRSRMIVSDSESSDEFMKPPPRRSVDCRTLQAKGSSEERFARKRDMAEPDRNGFVKRNHEASGSLAKMNNLDVFEFDEYDGFDNAVSIRNGFDNDSVGVSGRSSFGPSRVDSSVGGSGSGRNGPFDRTKNSYVNGTSSMSSQEDYTSESDSGEPIRVQGRNGVLKVKVKNKMSAEGGVKIFEEVQYMEPKCCSKVNANNKISTLSASISRQEAEISQKPPSSGKAQKREFVKPTLRKSNDVDNNSDSEGSDMSRKFKRRKPECRKPKKEVNTKSSVKPTMREERKGRRGAGTEKQRLRERIKGMLTDAGWTIEYRPRRNQSYLDAVYINPSGTAYWSIIKAYDALLKQINEEEIDARSKKDAAVVASVTEEIVNNLARKNKKVQTKVTKRWKKDSSGSDCGKESDGADSDTREQRHNSFVKLVGKSTKKGRNQTDLDDLPSKSKSYNDGRPSSGSNSHYLHGRKSRKMGRCTLLVRSSKDEKNPAIDGFNPYSGKRTLLSWLIESGVVQLRQKVQYMNSRCTKVMLEGWITREGIHCVCCSKILTLSRFEVHAGSKLCQPFQNIYLETGVSLLQCQLRAWNLQKDYKSLGFHQVDTDGDDPNDDACGICGDGGDLICCDGCPSTYHQTCLGVQVLPPGDWHCPNCTCKFCDAAVDSGVEDGNVLPLLSCNMCERRYHQSCMSELDAKVKSLGSASSFCGSKCLELFEKLQKYLGVKNEIEGGYSWSLIHRVDTDLDSNSQLSAQRIEINSKLAVGLAIMDECFLPIVDRRSGVNLIRNVLYNCGSNFNRINYAGFYTAILERGDEIISAASLRFHGMQLAEMPFIGTRHIYRRQGMCRRLFDAIESAMRSLKIEKLVIPAIPDFLHAWTGNFGFTPLNDSVRKEMRSLNTLVFPGIDVLQKPLFNNIAATAVNVLHEDPLIEPVKLSEFLSSAEVFTHSNDAADCYKNIVAPDEDNIHISVETVTISKPEEEMMKYFPGGECRITSSSCQTRIKSGTKRVSGYGYPFEDTGSSCDDCPTDVIAEPNACLDSQEIQQASADYKACAIFRVENNLSSSGRGSSDLSSISQEAKSEHNSINGIPSCKDTTASLSITKLADSNLISYCKDEDSHQKDDAFADGFLL